MQVACPYWLQPPQPGMSESQAGALSNLTLVASALAPGSTPPCWLPRLLAAHDPVRFNGTIAQEEMARAATVLGSLDPGRGHSPCPFTTLLSTSSQACWGSSREMQATGVGLPSAW